MYEEPEKLTEGLMRQFCVKHKIKIEDVDVIACLADKKFIDSTIEEISKQDNEKLQGKTDKAKKLSLNIDDLFKSSDKNNHDSIVQD